MITQPAHELTFGDLLLTGPFQATDWTYKTLGDGMTFGSAQPLEQTIASLLQDGSLVVTRGHDNREPTFLVKIEAEDAISLAEGEKALFLECSRPNLLSWTPPDGLGATSVFEVFTSSLEPIFDDVKELLVQRVYRLRLVCHPFTRSVDEVVTPALEDPPVSPTVVVISDGTSAIGWTSPDPGLISTAGKILVTGHRTSTPPVWLPGGGMDQYGGAADATLTMAATDFSVTPYLSLEVTPAAGVQVGSWAPAVYADGVLLDLVHSVPISGGKRFTYLVEDASVTTLRILQTLTQQVTHGATPGSQPKISLDNISRTDLNPGISTTGQSSLRRLTVEGSARTQGSLAVTHETGGLGDVILYTSPVLVDDYQPELMRYHVGGGRTVDADAVITGSQSNLMSASVPIGVLPPGGYVLVARMMTETFGGEDVDLAWTAETVIGGEVVATATSDAVRLPLLDHVFANYLLGGLVLPPAAVPGESTGTVDITIPGLSAQQIDEVWAFWVGDDSALTLVTCGEGTPTPGLIHNRLWVNSPTILDPRPTVYVGTEDDQSDAFHAGGLAAAWGLHSFTPGPMLVYIANSGEPNPAMELRHFPRWFTHAVS